MRTDRNHGSPYDRGSADAYYGRPIKPHYYLSKEQGSKGKTTFDKVNLVIESKMFDKELADYQEGYAWQVSTGVFKAW